MKVVAATTVVFRKYLLANRLLAHIQLKYDSYITTLFHGATSLLLTDVKDVKCVGDNFDMLVIDLVIFVTNFDLRAIT